MSRPLSSCAERVRTSITSAVVVTAWYGRATDIDVLERAIALDVALDQVNQVGLTPLMHAIISPSVSAAVISSILDTNAVDVNYVNQNGESALHFAGLRRDADVVDALVAAGADINHADASRATVLKIAATRGHLAVVQTLLEGGADSTIEDQVGYTALLGAAKRGHLAVIDLLVAHGVDINHVDHYGRNALMIAAAVEHLPTVERLVSLGLLMDQVDEQGRDIKPLPEDSGAVLKCLRRAHIDSALSLLHTHVATTPSPGARRRRSWDDYPPAPCDAAIGQAEGICAPSPGNDPDGEPGQETHRRAAPNVGDAVIPCDIAASSIETLASLVAPFDIVISCTGFAAGRGTQIKITEVVLLAGVKKYVPWQFGVDFEVIGFGSAQAVFDEQLHVRQILRSPRNTTTEFLVVSTGLFCSYLFEPAFGIVERTGPSQITVRALGSWETKVTVTTIEDIGALTVAITTSPATKWNQVHFIGGDTLTYKQVAQVVRETFGDHEVVTEEWTVDALRRDLSVDPANIIKKYRVVFAEGAGVSWETSVTWNVRHGVKATTVRVWVAAHPEGVQVSQ